MSDYWGSIYKKPISDIPWEIDSPPQELVELIEKEILKPCRALDVGCGTGNYSIYLAKNGFEVTGIDISKKAIAIAKTKAKNTQFIASDVFSFPLTYNDSFGFILEYSVLHHISFEKTDNYVARLFSLLRKGGYLLLVCYSEKDEYAKGKRTAVGKYGNTMYYRTKEEIRSAYKSFQEISYKETTLGKQNQHKSHCFLFRKS